MYQITAENQGKFKKSLKDLTKSQVNLFDLLASMFFRYGQISPSQQFIANRIGFCRETINRGVAELLDLGLIEVDPQKRKMPGFTCAYRICSWITKDMCKLFYKILKSFRYFHVKYLCSRTDLFNKKKNVTLVNYINNNLLFNKPKPNLNLVIKETYYEENRVGLVKKVTKSKEDKKMSEVVSTPGTNMAQEVLNLTPWGKIRCRLFEDDAILYAIGALAKAERTSEIKDRFGYFFSIASKYTLDRHKSLNNKRFLFLKESYAMPDDAPMCLPEEKKTIKGEKVSYSNKDRVNQRAYSPERERYGEISNRKLAEYKEQQARADHNYIEEIKEQVRFGRMDEKTARERIEARLARTIS